MQNADASHHNYSNMKNQQNTVDKGREGPGNEDKNRKKQMDFKGIQVTKAE